MVYKELGPGPGADTGPFIMPRHKVKLNLGCGTDIQEGYVNVDIRDLPGVDLVGDVRMLPAVEAEYIRAIDVVEHMPQKEAERAVAHWVSMLSHGGIIEIQCPDVVHAAGLAARRGDDWFIRLLYGAQDYPENTHVAGFTLATMEKLLKSLGLQIILGEQTKNGNLHVKAQKP